MAINEETTATAITTNGDTSQSSGRASDLRSSSTGWLSGLVSAMADLVGKMTAAAGATFLAACAWRLLGSDKPAWVFLVTVMLIPVTLAPLSAWPALATGAAGVVSALTGRGKS